MKLALLEGLKCDNANGSLGPRVEEVEGEVDMLLLSDEQHWRQRSRVVWLEAGDKTSRYFHQFANQCRKKKFVLGLLNGEGH